MPLSVEPFVSILSLLEKPPENLYGFKSDNGGWLTCRADGVENGVFVSYEPSLFDPAENTPPHTPVMTTLAGAICQAKEQKEATCVWLYKGEWERVELEDDSP